MPIVVDLMTQLVKERIVAWASAPWEHDNTNDSRGNTRISLLNMLRRTANVSSGGLQVMKF